MPERLAKKRRKAKVERNWRQREQREYALHPNEYECNGGNLLTCGPLKEAMKREREALLGIVVERKRRGKQKIERGWIRNNTTHDNGSTSKRWTSPFLSPSSTLPLCYLIQLLDSLSELLLHQPADRRKGLEQKRGPVPCPQTLFDCRSDEGISSVYFASLYRMDGWPSIPGDTASQSRPVSEPYPVNVSPARCIILNVPQNTAECMDSYPVATTDRSLRHCLSFGLPIHIRVRSVPIFPTCSLLKFDSHFPFLDKYTICSCSSVLASVSSVSSLIDTYFTTVLHYNSQKVFHPNLGRAWILDARERRIQLQLGIIAGPSCY
jgi:hypothetical protein